MQRFIRKHFLILMFLTIGIILGGIFYINSPKNNVYYVVYEYPSAELNNLSSIFKNDTLIENEEGLVYRNVNSSYADTSRAQGVNRGELKIYSQNKLNKEVIQQIFNSIKESEQPTLLISNLKRTSKSILPILKFALLGLFIGTVLHFLKGLKSSSQEK